MSTSDLDLPLLPSAEQIRRREFATLRRGYDPDQVRTYLQAVAVQVETLEKQIREAKLRLEAASESAAGQSEQEDPYEELGKRFAGLIGSADREAGRMLDEAKAEAARTLDEARMQAERVRISAQSRAEEARQEGSHTLEKAKIEADRILAGLSTRRQALVTQLQEMQTRLLSVARDLETAIDERDDIGAEAARVESQVAGRASKADAGDAGAITGKEGDTVDPRYEDLWVSSEPTRSAGTETADDTVDIPDLASIDIDFDDDRPKPDH